MQVILGAGGAVGRQLAEDLRLYTFDIRLAGRNPKKINPTDTIIQCDLTNKEQVMKAVEGSEVAYLTAGLEYNINVWREKWPVIMRNVIEACKTHNSKLVFFDNVYMYDCAEIPHMTEETTINPCSEKGKVRAEIYNMLMDEVKSGGIKALVARAADFYGPDVATSPLQMTVYENFKKGKAANLLGNPDLKHSYTYVPDAAKGTAMLGNDDSAYGQVWHLPTRDNPPTGREIVDLFAKEMNVKPKLMPAGKFLVKMIGLFNPVMKEIPEMMYQNTQDYVFDSSKFNAKYNFTPTSYEEGVKKIVHG